jgi:hypothetical protein
MSGDLEQRRLHEALTRMLQQARRQSTPFGGPTLKTPVPPLLDVSWFVATQESLMALYEPVNALAAAFLRISAAAAGLRSADEQFTFEGHLQLWCEGVAYDWWVEPGEFMFCFGSLVRPKVLLANGLVQAVAHCQPPEGSSHGGWVKENYRPPRVGERNLRRPDGSRVECGSTQSVLRSEDAELVAKQFSAPSKLEG